TMPRYRVATVSPVSPPSAERSFCDPNPRMVGIVQSTVPTMTGRRPVPVVSLGAADCKHWRPRGVPAYVYGCTPNNMAKPDEWVDVEEYLHIVRTHALSAARYLMS